MIPHDLEHFFSKKINDVKSFSTCKKLHLGVIGMANFSKWKYWSDSVFPYTM